MAVIHTHRTMGPLCTSTSVVEESISLFHTRMIHVAIQRLLGRNLVVVDHILVSAAPAADNLVPLPRVVTVFRAALVVVHLNVVAIVDAATIVLVVHFTAAVVLVLVALVVPVVLGSRRGGGREGAVAIALFAVAVRLLLLLLLLPDKWG